MRMVVCFFLSITVSSSAFCGQITLIPNELVLNKITENITVVTHSFPWESNSLIVVSNKNNIVLIDTPYTNEATELLYNWILREYDPKLIEVIVTGYHIDNIGGIEFLRSKNVEITGTELTNKLIISDSQNTLKTLLTWLNESTQKKYYEYYKNVSLIKTTKEIIVNDLYIYNMDNLSLELFYPGESHAKDNITVYIKNEDVLFGSCIIKSKESKNLGFTGDANLKHWPFAVTKIKDRYSSVKIVIPHHGKWSNTELFEHTLSLF